MLPLFRDKQELTCAQSPSISGEVRSAEVAEKGHVKQKSAQMEANAQKRLRRKADKKGLQILICFNSTGKPQAEELLDTLSEEIAEKKVKKEDIAGGRLLAVMFQEHKQQKAAWPVFKAKCARKGWHMVGGAASQGEAGGASSGTAIAAHLGRAPLGTIGGTHEVGKEEHPGRVSMACMQGGAFPSMMLLTVYFYTGEPLHAKCNLAILRALAELIASTGALWILAADFQNTPSDLAETGWLGAVGGRVAATKSSTSSTGRVIDFFALDERLAEAFAYVKVWPWPPRTHRPVELGLRLGQASFKVRKLVYPKPFPRQRPIGPARAPTRADVWEKPEGQTMQPEVLEAEINTRYKFLVQALEGLLCDICDCYKDGERNVAFMGREKVPRVVWRDVRPRCMGEFGSLPLVGRKLATLYEKLCETENLTRKRLSGNDGEKPGNIKGREWTLRADLLTPKGNIEDAVAHIEGKSLKALRTL